MATDYEILRVLIDLRENVLQKQRIALGNRLDAIERGVDTVDENTRRIINTYYNRFEELEQMTDIEIKALVYELPIVQAMVNVKGIGLMLAARVVSMIDITLVDHVSALWKWAGYAVVNGEADKPHKGEKLQYNPRLKTTLYLVGESFLKSRSPYRNIYDHWKEVYEQREPESSKMRIHRRAMRKMIKRWLADLWYVWRTIEGLPTTKPYAHAILGHTDYERPEKYGWRVGAGSIDYIE